MNLVVVLASILAGPVPDVLTTPDPARLIRWPALDLAAEPKGTRPTPSARFQLAGSGVLRFLANGKPCPAQVSRLAVAGSATLALPLPISPDGTVVVPPQVAAPATPGSEESRPVELDYRVERTVSCPTGTLRGYRAAIQMDDNGPIAADRVIRALLDRPPSPTETLAWLASPFPHRWQEAAALFVTIWPWLGKATVKVPGLRAALVDLYAEADGVRTTVQNYTFMRELTLPLSKQEIGPDRETFFLLRAGQAVDIDVNGKSALRVVGRAILAEADNMAAWRIRVDRDGQLADVVLSASTLDPLAPGFTRQRTEILRLPKGSKRLRLTALDGAVALRGILIKAKHVLGDAFSQRPNLPAPIPTAPGMPPGLPDVIARLAPKAPDDPNTLIVAEAILSGWKDPAWGNLARLLRARLVRVQTVHHLLRGEYRQARAALMGMTKTGSLCDEDAALLAKLDLASGDPTEVGTGAIGVLDQLITQRPLDESLLDTRALAFSAFSQWRALLPVGKPQEVSFLVDLPAMPMGTSPGRSTFVSLPAKTDTRIILPKAAMPDHHPVLSLLAAAPNMGAASIVIDGGQRITLPLRLPFERIDLPLPPGPHTIRLENAPNHSWLFVNQAPPCRPPRVCGPWWPCHPKAWNSCARKWDSRDY